MTRSIVITDGAPAAIGPYARGVRVGNLIFTAGQTPIDPATKEALRLQIETTVAEQKQFAEQAEKGVQPVVPDLSAALADPNHVYPVCRSISVPLADGNPAGNLTEGDLCLILIDQVDEALAHIAARIAEG